MVDNIFYTAVVFWLMTQLFIGENQAENLHDSVKIIVLTVWSASLITIFTTALIKIWA